MRNEKNGNWIIDFFPFYFASFTNQQEKLEIEYYFLIRQWWQMVKNDNCVDRNNSESFQRTINRRHRSILIASVKFFSFRLKKSANFASLFPRIRMNSTLPIAKWICWKVMLLPLSVCSYFTHVSVACVAHAGQQISIYFLVSLFLSFSDFPRMWLHSVNAAVTKHSR